jgi:DNA primase
MADPVIDEIKQRVDLADLVGQTVQLKKSGRYLKGLCPFHRERTPSFYVYPEQGTYHCFGCGKTGDVFTWVQETEQLDFGEALRRLAARAGVPLPARRPQGSERGGPEPERAPPVGAEALQAAAAWYHEQLLHGAAGGPARDYLRERGVTLETAARFGLGWAPERWDALYGHLRRQGFSDQALEEAGLVIRAESGVRDRFRGRLLFPIRSADGQVLGFGGRVLGEARDGQPKYLNSPQTAYFDKSAVLYGLDLARGAIRREGEAVIVEGYLDVVVPHQAGFQNVVASLGTAITEQQVALLRRYTSTMVLALDADAAGQEATLRGLEVARRAMAARRRPVPGAAARGGFLALSSGEIKIALLQGGKDPDQIVREDPQAWRQAIQSAVPMVEHKLAVELARVDLRDPQSKLAAVRELARFLVLVPDRIAWAHYVDVIAQRLRLDLRAVQAEVSRAERAVRAAERQAERERERAGAAGPEGRPAEGTAASGTAPGAAPGGGTAGAQGTRAGPARDEWGEEVAEEHLVLLLLLAPRLIRRMPVRLGTDDFFQPTCRELYRSVLAYLASSRDGGGASPAGASGAGTEPPRGLPATLAGGRDDPFRLFLDASLVAYYDALVAQSRRLPPYTDSQLEADLVGVVRRIKERNLRRQLLEAQYLLAESEGDEERAALAQKVGQLAGQLGRIHLERSRAAFYTSPPG